MTLRTEIQKHFKNILLFGIVLILLAGGFLLVKNAPLIADEHVHYGQILDILEGTNLLPKVCPYLPGYHWTMAGLSRLLHDSRGPAMRFSTTLLSFFCFIVFFLLARKIDKGSTIQKSLLFIMCPIFFPLFSLIYTDIYSMAFVFLSLALALDRRLWLSGIVGILGLAVRQNNIVWIAMIALVAYAENYYPQHQWKDVKQWIGKFLFFFLALALMAAFVFWNKGFVFGDRTNHVLSFTCGNLFFLLFFFFFLFLPYNLSNFPKIACFLKTHKLMGVVLAEVFLVYLLFFKADHPYNSMARHIHNWILWSMAGSFLTRCLCFLPIGYSILSLCVTPLRQKSFYLLYPFTILFLLPNAVIEIRYCFIPYALFLSFKEKDPERIVLFTLAIYLVATGCVLYLMKDQMFFL
jgi:hypothetical protein